MRTLLCAAAAAAIALVPALPVHAAEYCTTPTVWIGGQPYGPNGEVCIPGP